MLGLEIRGTRIDIRWVILLYGYATLRDYDEVFLRVLHVISQHTVEILYSSRRV